MAATSAMTQRRMRVQVYTLQLTPQGSIKTGIAMRLKSFAQLGLVLVVFNELEDEEKWWLRAESSSLLVQIYRVAKKIEMIQ